MLYYDFQLLKHTEDIVEASTFYLYTFLIQISVNMSDAASKKYIYESENSIYTLSSHYIYYKNKQKNPKFC